MEELKTLLIGILGGFLVLGISKFHKSYRRKSIKEEIQDLEYEKELLTNMKRSSVELTRSSFRFIFAVFMFFALANLVPSLFTLLEDPIFNKVARFFEIFFWACSFSLSLLFWRRYDDLKNFESTSNKLDEKIEKLKSKIEDNCVEKFLYSP